MPRDLRQAAGFLLGIALAFWLSPLGAKAAELDALEAELLRQVNQTRQHRHLLELRRSPELDAVARAHSRDMATRGYIAHESPDGAIAVHRLERARIEGFTLAAENIGNTNVTPASPEIVRAWLASPVHRRNLLAPAFNATGIGMARAADGSLLVTQLYVTYPR